MGLGFVRFEEQGGSKLLQFSPRGGVVKMGGGPPRNIGVGVVVKWCTRGVSRS